MSKTALYVGRFQPFHLGHLDAIKQIFADGADLLLIVIGSAENELNLNNPFTTSERFEMIFRSLEQEGIPREKYFIIPVRDINNPLLWVEHVQRLIPPFDCVYGGEEDLCALFASKGIEAKEIVKKVPVRGYLVREKIFKNEDIRALVPAGTYAVLQKIDLNKRLI